MPSNDWHFDYHGYMRAPLRFGLGKNQTPNAAANGQATSTIHTPVVPDDQYVGGWAYTSLQSRDWAEAFFSYGNNFARATVGVLGFGFTDAAWTSSGTQPNPQFGIGLGWVTLDSEPRLQECPARGEGG